MTLPSERATSLLIGNGDAMGIGAEITQHVFRSSERSLGVDDPVVTEQYPQPRGEGTRFRKQRCPWNWSVPPERRS